MPNDLAAAHDPGCARRLALRTNAVVLPIYGNGIRGYIFHSYPAANEFVGNATDDATVLAAVQAIDAVMTSPIVRLLDQW